MNWEEAIREYQLYLRIERGMSDNTLSAYLRDLLRYRTYTEEILQIAVPSQLKLEDIRKFILFLAEDCFLGERSLARNISVLRSFHSFLLADGISAHDPSEQLHLPRFHQYLPTVLSFPEVEAIFSTFDLKTPHGLRNRAMLEVLYSSGLRVSELVQLDISRVFKEEGFIRILGKGKKERLVPIGSPALILIDQYLTEVRLKQLPKAGHEDVLFLSRRGKQLSRVLVFQVIKEACLKAGIKKNISPHTFRHTFATHLLEGGADLTSVQDMLGHESITTTEIYLHMDREYLREIHAMYHPRN